MGDYKQIRYNKKVVVDILKELRKRRYLTKEEMIEFFESHFPYKSNKRTLGLFTKHAGYRQSQQIVKGVKHKFYIREDEE